MFVYIGSGEPSKSKFWQCFDQGMRGKSFEFEIEGNIFSKDQGLFLDPSVGTIFHCMYIKRKHVDLGCYSLRPASKSSVWK